MSVFTGREAGCPGMRTPPPALSETARARDPLRRALNGDERRPRPGFRKPRRQESKEASASARDGWIATIGPDMEQSANFAFRLDRVLAVIRTARSPALLI